MNCSVGVINSLGRLRFWGGAPSRVYERVMWEQQPEMFYNVREFFFSCEFCEISKNIFFTEQLQTTACGAEPPWCNFQSLFSVYFIFQIVSFNKEV